MTWIKRNLGLVIGSAVALILMVWAGFALKANWSKNKTATSEVEAAYSELQRLYGQNPHPGDSRIDNIKKAREEKEQVEQFIQSALQHFQPIEPIPAGDRVSGEQFTAQLSRTIDQLQKQATIASVQLPPKYNFTFAAQVPLIKFAPGSLEPLAKHLGEIKAICDVLFAARVNALDSIRRERVSQDDSQGFSDYLDRQTQTNDLALMVPYEITFRCFSAELAKVLNGFADSEHGFYIQTVNVEPAPDSGLTNVFDAYGAPTASAYPYPAQPTYTPQAYPQYPTRRGVPEEEMEMGRRMASRGGAAGRYGAGQYGAGARGYPPATQVQRVVQRQPTGTAARSGGLETIIDEGPLRVTMLVEVIRFLPPPENNF
jgi:hypothetical protein